ncbi:uncharacterized protein LOC108166580 isoform X2 [Poecilia reticulata]|uniref:uncharacterized protein LOC108166580 isoform X2 n=1 Tax=Poecilia reticulata TaxID=8081 RepID=UPI0007E9F2FB|nr:PREDICTED: uncharacterized protein LOC108166580 isoform X2 [Poecilia reticulata]
MSQHFRKSPHVRDFLKRRRKEGLVLRALVTMETRLKEGLVLLLLLPQRLSEPQSLSAFPPIMFSPASCGMLASLLGEGSLLHGSVLMGLRIQLPCSEVALTAAEEVQHLTRKIGENVTFDLGAQDLKHADHVIWSRGAGSSVIYSVYIGEDQMKQLSRCNLSLRSGSLSIHDLRPADSDVYLGQIINGRGTRKLFNLTVEDSDPPTSDPPHSREPWVIPVIVTVCIVTVGLFSYAVKRYFCSSL